MGEQTSDHDRRPRRRMLFYLGAYCLLLCGLTALSRRQLHVFEQGYRGRDAAYVAGQAASLRLYQQAKQTLRDRPFTREKIEAKLPKVRAIKSEKRAGTEGLYDVVTYRDSSTGGEIVMSWTSDGLFAGLVPHDPVVPEPKPPLLMHEASEVRRHVHNLAPWLWCISMILYFCCGTREQRSSISLLVLAMAMLFIAEAFSSPRSATKERLAWGGVLLSISFMSVWRGFRRPSAAERGVCEKCGYDLRATPERCPECGLVPEKYTRYQG